MPELHLLITKFKIPPTRHMLIQRPHLIERINQHSSLPLILLSAAAGFGKTSLLSAWAGQSGQRISWFTLDEQDNDPARFWTSLVATLQQSGSCLNFSSEEVATTPLHVILTSLINDLATSEAATTLILDDYHVIEEPTIHASLLFLLDHAPSSLRLILASRVDPPLALSRWRARGQMLEIKDADLRLSEVETAAFLSQVMGLHLEQEEVQALMLRTEGWIAGIQLAALALLRNEKHDWLHRLNGGQRFILDYVRDEIVTSQPAHLQRFLFQTAVLTELNAALCQAVTGEQASQKLLESLERANLFVVPLDEERQQYRYHPLFREALLVCLRETEPASISPLHQRAAAWYAAHSYWVLAIPHALDGEDYPLAADLIERFIDARSHRNEYHTLRRWLARLPGEVLRSRPGLSFMYALTLIYTSQRGPQMLDLVEDFLQWAEQGFRDTSNQAELGAVLTTRAVLACFQGAFAHAFALARLALTLLPDHNRRWRCHCLSILGTQAALAGHFNEAQTLIEQGLAYSDASGSLPGMQFATLLLGEVYLGKGELQKAASAFRQALVLPLEQQELAQLQLVLEMGTRERYYERVARYGLAALAYEWNELEKAQQYMQEALAEVRPIWTHALSPGLLLQVRLMFAQGEGERARDMLNNLALQAHQPEIRREINLCTAWLALKMEDVASAQRWAASSAQEGEFLALARREEEILLLARLRIEEGQPESALRLLAHWKETLRLPGRLHGELQFLVLEALAHQRAGADEPARAYLLEALTKARPEGYRRLFLDEGTVMESFLKTLLPDLREKPLAAYVRLLLRAFTLEFAKGDALADGPAPSLPDSLTPQEQRVLQLLAEGASNQAIADALVISTATARKHVSNILSKLGAINRTQAIARAREYALL